MSGYETIVYEKKGKIARITLNRPHVLNIYNVQMRDELYEVLGAVKADRDVYAVIMKGAGEKAFCAGADLSEFLSAPSPTSCPPCALAQGCMGTFPQPPSTGHSRLARLCIRGRALRWPCAAT